jgi:hypothetical protein
MRARRKRARATRHKAERISEREAVTRGTLSRDAAPCSKLRLAVPLRTVARIAGLVLYVICIPETIIAGRELGIGKNRHVDVAHAMSARRTRTIVRIAFLSSTPTRAEDGPRRTTGFTLWSDRYGNSVVGVGWRSGEVAMLILRQLGGHARRHLTVGARDPALKMKAQANARFAIDNPKAPGKLGPRRARKVLHLLAVWRTGRANGCAAATRIHACIAHIR